jgi:hypothetical protein
MKPCPCAACPRDKTWKCDHRKCKRFRAWFAVEWLYDIIENTEWETVLAALRSELDRVDPKPLTLEQLRERDGEPVWTTMIGSSTGRWELVAFDNPPHDKNPIMTLANLEDGLYDVFERFYGKTWVAYDSPPNDNT